MVNRRKCVKQPVRLQGSRSCHFPFTRYQLIVQIITIILKCGDEGLIGF
jgi:hypothetical protein